MKFIAIGKNNYHFPTCWDELTGAQLVQVMEILFLKGYSPEKLLLQLVKILAGMTTYQFLSLRGKVEEMEEVFYLTAFLFHPDLAFTKNLLPVHVSGVVRYYGPEHYLANLRMSEFAFTDAHFKTWYESEKKDEVALNNLVAILYRPAPAGYNLERNEAGDKRVPYNENGCVYAATHEVAKWPMAVKLAIATWYDGCCRALAAHNDDVFGGEGGEVPKYGLVSLMLQVADGGTFGTYKEVEEVYVHLVMMQLNEMVAQNKKLAAEVKA